MHLTPWILSPIVWFFLPGYALTGGRQITRMRLLPIVGISFLLTSALSLVLVFFGIFNARLVTVLLLLLLPLAAYRYWRRVIPFNQNKMNSILAKLYCSLLFVGSLCILPQVAQLFSTRQPYRGACDSGVYIAAASHLSREGRFDWDGAELLPADSGYRNLAIRTTHYHFPWKETWPGIVQVRDRFAPQFFPLYPIWLSLFRSAAFPSHPFYYLNLWCLSLAISFLALLSRSLLPMRFAWLPLVGLILNPGIIYFWDYPLAEIFLAFIFIALLVFLTYGLRYKIPSFLALSACFLAAGMATKYMAWFLLAPVLLIWVLAGQDKWFAKYFIIPWWGALIFPFACLLLWNMPHFMNHFLPKERLLQALLFVVGLEIVRRIARVEAVRRTAPVVVGTLFTFAVVAFVFFLPNSSELSEENVLPELAWYTGWGWLVLAFIGCWVLLFKKGKDAKPILVFFLLMLGVAFAGTADNPLHPFAFRRHIPVLLPLIALLAVVALHWLRRLGRIALTAIVFLSAVPPLVLGVGMMSAGEGNGFLPLLAKVSKELPEGPVFGLDDAEWIASQAQLLAQKPVYPLHMETAEGLEAYQTHAAGEGSIKILTGQVLPYSKIGDWSGGIEHLRPERNRRPSIIETQPVRLFLYDVPLDLTRAGERIEVGGDDFGRVAGFWGPERDGERPFRWSRQWCHFILQTRGGIVLTINASGHPENPVPFRIYIGRELIAGDFAAPGWKDFAFALPAGFQDRRVAFSLVTHTFQPLPDTRELGLMIASIGSFR